MIRSSFFYENRRMSQGTLLTELKLGKILAYKDSGMSIHQIAKNVSRSRKVVSNFLRDPNCYTSIRNNVECEEKLLRKLRGDCYRAATNQITSASKSRRSMEIKFQCYNSSASPASIPTTYGTERWELYLGWLNLILQIELIGWKITSAGILSEEIWYSVTEKSWTWTVRTDSCITGMTWENARST